VAGQLAGIAAAKVWQIVVFTLPLQTLLKELYGKPPGL
jgi:hypothetical protein